MIKTIIFDFGDVFLNLDKPATEKALQQYQIFRFSDDMLQRNKEFEKGMVTSKEFVSDYCKEFPQLTSEAFTGSWNSILVNFPVHRYRFLKKLKEQKKYKLILLSNTNEIHIDWVTNNIGFFKDFKACFDAFYLSHEINLRKPDLEIYRFVLDRHQLIPEETLFIDDTPENTEAAARLGIQTWNIDPEKEDVTELFTIKKELF